MNEVNQEVGFNAPVDAESIKRSILEASKGEAAQAEDPQPEAAPVATPSV